MSTSAFVQHVLPNTELYLGFAIEAFVSLLSGSIPLCFSEQIFLCHSPTYHQTQPSVGRVARSELCLVSLLVMGCMDSRQPQTIMVLRVLTQPSHPSAPGLGSAHWFPPSVGWFRRSFSDNTEFPLVRVQLTAACHLGNKTFPQ